MRITEDHLVEYENNGFLFSPGFFSQAEVDAMRAELPALFNEDSPRRVIEKDGNIVRSVYGSHTTNEVFSRLTRHARIVEAVRLMLKSEAYIYQFKINAKAAFGGDIWEWHQDYIFWQKEDGMPSPRVTSLAIFLDEVTEFNGPLFLIPGSHLEGVIGVSSRDALFSERSMHKQIYSNSPKWISNLTADLKYSLDAESVASLIEKYGIVAPKGPAGSALFFQGNTVHGSSSNISPWSRIVVIITYNSIENIPVPDKEPRPDFLVSRDYAPVQPLVNDPLFV